jgi:dolichyl-phosphate-mannose-protein mannosyltransferase
MAGESTDGRTGDRRDSLLRSAAFPLAAALALSGQVLLSRSSGLYKSLLPGVVLLVLGALLVIVVLLRRRFDGTEEPRLEKRTTTGLGELSPAVEWTLVALLVFGGFYLRLYRIDIIPRGLNNDEAINAIETRDILDDHGHSFATLTTRGLNRETMFHYLAAFSFRSAEIELNLLTAMPAVFGLTPRFVGDPLMGMIFPLRAVAIAAGTLTILVLYLFARRRFGPPVALVATAFLAVSPWHILYSRVGERAILAPLFAIATIGFFLDALDSGRTRDHIAWGLCLGLGFWSYTSFRAIPIAMLAFWLLRRPLGWAGGVAGPAVRRAGWMALGLAGSVLAVLMLLSGIGPWGFVTRGAYAVLITPKANHWLNLFFSLVMPHYSDARYAVIQSDAFISDGMSPVYGLIGLAPETTVVAALSALGLVYALWRALRRQDAACGLLVLCFLSLVLTVGVAGPSLTRMLPNVPWLCLFAALLARRLFEDVARLRPPLTTWLAAVLITPLVGWSAVQGFSNYFLRAGLSEQAMQHFGATQTIMGMYVRTLPQDQVIYVLHTLRVDTLRYLIGDRPNVHLVSDPSTLDLDGIIKMPKTATLVIELARPFAEPMRYLIMRYPLGDATQLADARFDPDKILMYTFTLWKDERGQPMQPPGSAAPGAAPPAGGPIPGDVPPLGQSLEKPPS